MLPYQLLLAVISLSSLCICLADKCAVTEDIYDSICQYDGPLIPSLKLTQQDLDELELYQNSTAEEDEFYEYNDPRPINLTLTQHEESQLQKMIASSFKKQEPVLTSNDATSQNDETERLHKTFKEKFGESTSDNTICSQTMEKLGCPFIFAKPDCKRAVEGEDISLTCSAVGDPKPDLIWFKNGKLIESDSNHGLFQNRQLLLLRNMSMDDIGIYECKAFNTLGFQRARAVLLVKSQSLPNFVVPPVSQEVVDGGNVVFDCAISGYPVPNVVWFFRGEDGQSDTFEVPRTNGLQFATSIRYYGGRIVSEGTRLILTRANSKDSGLYLCVAFNQFQGHLGSVGAWLKVFNNSNEVENNTIIEFIRAEEGRVVETYKRKKYINNHQVDQHSTAHDKMKKAMNPDAKVSVEDLRRQVFETSLRQFYQPKRMRGLSPSIKLGARVAPILPNKVLKSLMQSSQCIPQLVVHCPINATSANEDGSCNNINNPSLGASKRPFRRLLYPDYEDGYTTPTGFTSSLRYFGFRKPPPRTVSVLLLAKETVRLSSFQTDLFTHVSQFLYHDTTFSPFVALASGARTGKECHKTCENDLPCFPIQVTKQFPNSPPNLRPMDSICFPFHRTAGSCEAIEPDQRTPTPRAQTNALTSAIDLSNLYGSDAEVNRQLFDQKDPTARHKLGAKGLDNQDLLPFVSNTSKNCQFGNTRIPMPCFLAGEVRASAHPMLITMHTLMARVHNRLAGLLVTLNPSWIRQRERLYQETRKLLVALWQRVIYEELLPLHLGQKGMMEMGEYSGYKSDVDFRFTNEAAAAAARQGHFRIRDHLFRLNASGNPIPQGNLPFYKGLFNPLVVIEEGGITPYLRGAFMTPAKVVDSRQPFSQSMADNFLRTKKSRGGDMAAVDIQRNREFGITGYNRYRVACGLSWAHTFDDLKEEIVDPDVRFKLEKLYGYPDNIDLGVAIGLEKPVDGSSFGNVGLCILTDQMKRLRDGDRFFYLNNDFTEKQLDLINSAKLSTLICLGTTDIETISKDVFFLPSRSKLTTCTELVSKFNLEAWKSS